MSEPINTPTIAVIIPCKGHAAELRQCLAGLMKSVNAPPHELIVVSAQEDPQVASTVKEFPPVQLVGNADALLPGEARNMGVENTRAEIIAFIDADCIPDPHWIAAAAKSVSLPRRLTGGPVKDAFPWHPIAVSDNLLHLADFPSGRPSGQAHYFPACNMAIRREDFEAVGRFEHGDQPFGEDTQFCEKVLERWPNSLWFDARMVVQHSGRLTFASYLQHHYGFGYARGILGLHLKPSHLRWGKCAVMIGPVAMKRLTYIAKRVIHWRTHWTPVLVLLLPLILPGLLSWATGLRKGLRNREG